MIHQRSRMWSAGAEPASRGRRAGDDRHVRQQAGHVTAQPSSLHHLVRLFCAGLLAGLALGLVGGALRQTSGSPRSMNAMALARSRIAVLERSRWSSISLLRLINGARAQAGRRALRLDPRLSIIARARSWDMIVHRYFSHRRPDGQTVFDLLDRAHLSYAVAGENLAMNNYALFVTPATVLRLTERDLLRSREHRRNLIDPAYRRIGLGLVGDPATGRVVVTEILAGP